MEQAETKIFSGVLDLETCRGARDQYQSEREGRRQRG